MAKTDPSRPIRVVICWNQISGYMGACWRELSAREQIDLSVILLGNASGTSDAPFSSDVVRGVRCEVLPPERQNAGSVADLVTTKKPDAIVLCGWATPAYVALADHPALQDCRFVLAIDTALKENLRQRVGRHWMRAFLKRMDAAIVAGERSANLAAYLGIPPERICRGMYAVDVISMSAAATARAANNAPWPKRFLYLGRYAPEKGIDRLLHAYCAYRTLVSEPWQLTFCGKGELGGMLKGIDGVRDAGFVQPADLPRVMAEHGVLILPSRYEPWGAALVEACAAGLPVIATDACGASLDVVRTFHNGLLTTPEDEAALTRSMRWMHDHVEWLAEMGRRSMELASAFSAQRWADRWQDLFHRLIEK